MALALFSYQVLPTFLLPSSVQLLSALQNPQSRGVIFPLDPRSRISGIILQKYTYSFTFINMDDFFMESNLCKKVLQIILVN